MTQELNELKLKENIRARKRADSQAKYLQIHSKNSFRGFLNNFFRVFTLVFLSLFNNSTCDFSRLFCYSLFSLFIASSNILMLIYGKYIFQRPANNNSQNSEKRKLRAFGLR